MGNIGSDNFPAFATRIDALGTKLLQLFFDNFHTISYIFCIIDLCLFLCVSVVRVCVCVIVRVCVLFRCMHAVVCM